MPSPKPKPVVKPSPHKDLTFAQIVPLLLEDKKVTKREWEDEKFFIVIQDEKLRIHKDDDKYYDLIVRTPDLAGDDWYEIS